jgi:predicted outer membrane repeat protein
VGGSNGGAIQNVSDANAYISSSTFVNNSGSAIFNENSSPTINNSDFYNNFGDLGGAIQNRGQNSQPVITNSLFEGNTAAQLGGAIYNTEGEPTLINCTIVGNSAGIDGGGVASEGGQGRGPTIINSILWNNSDLEIYDDSSSLTNAVYSNVEGGYSGTGNIDLDPSFIDTTIGDYRLGFGSTCIDAGDNSSVSTPFDLIGNLRITNGIVDMGAYEYIP